MTTTIVAGGRDFELGDWEYGLLDKQGITLLVSGHARGADQGGEDWARSRGVPIETHPADWDTHGRAAGPIRNRQMAECAQALILFPGGRGTESMHREAVRAGLEITDLRGLYEQAVDEDGCVYWQRKGAEEQ